MEHRHFYEEACLFIDKIWTLQNEDRIKYYPDGSGFCKSISCRFWLEIWVVKYCELHCILRLKVQCSATEPEGEQFNQSSEWDAACWPFLFRRRKWFSITVKRQKGYWPFNPPSIERTWWHCSIFSFDPRTYLNRDNWRSDIIVWEGQLTVAGSLVCRVRRCGDFWRILSQLYYHKLSYLESTFYIQYIFMDL